MRSIKHFMRRNSLGVCYCPPSYQNAANRQDNLVIHTLFLTDRLHNMYEGGRRTANRTPVSSTKIAHQQSMTPLYHVMALQLSGEVKHTEDRVFLKRKQKHTGINPGTRPILPHARMSNPQVTIQEQSRETTPSRGGYVKAADPMNHSLRSAQNLFLSPTIFLPMTIAFAKV